MERIDWKKVHLDEIKEMLDEHLDSYEDPKMETPLTDYKLSMMCMELIRRLELKR